MTIDSELLSTQRILDGILGAVITALDEAEMPLTDEQRAFLTDASGSIL